MSESEIDAIRKLLSSKPRPVGWEERRQRIEEVGATWPVADDIKTTTVDVDGIRGEWTIAPSSDATRALLYFHGGGYCSGSIRSHRSLVAEAGRAAKVRTLAVAYRLAPEHPFPAALDDALMTRALPNRSATAPMIGCTMAKVKASAADKAAACAIETDMSSAMCGSTGSMARTERLAANDASAMR